MNAKGRRGRWMRLGLLAALLPSLVYLGHWSVRVPVPGTDALVALGAQAEHEAQTNEGGHAQHCHGTASCTDSPPTPVGPGFALLDESTFLLGAAGGLVAAIMLAWRPARAATVSPPLMPPRVRRASL